MNWFSENSFREICFFWKICLREFVFGEFVLENSILYSQMFEVYVFLFALLDLLVF